MECVSKILESFYCKLHPTSRIQQICSKANCESIFLCIKCIKEKHCVNHFDLVLSVEEFVDVISQNYETLRTIKSKSYVQPAELTHFLLKEEDHLEKLVDHVKQKKALINDAVTGLINEFIVSCNDFKEDLFKQLDDQIQIFKTNHKLYKNIVDNFYNKPNVCLGPTKSEIITTLNAQNTRMEFSIAVNKMKRTVGESRVTGTNDQKIARMKSIIKEKMQQLKCQADVQAVIQFEKNSNLESLIREHNSETKLFLEKRLSLEKTIEELEYKFDKDIDDSLIIKLDADKVWLSLLLSMDIKVNKLKLIYRGSRDGFTAAAFHKLCDGVENTVTLILSNMDKIFGGFVDVTWEYSSYGKYNGSDKAFLFSVTNKEKYPLKPKCQSKAIYCSSNYFAAFGGGHDIYLNDYCNTTTENRGNFGDSYDNKGHTAKSLFGAAKFSIKEVEVFQLV